jgi:aryl carrier-like protein
MQKLEKLINGEISDPTDRLETTKNLLKYCGQDSLAMVRIFEKLLKI